MAATGRLSSLSSAVSNILLFRAPLQSLHHFLFSLNYYTKKKKKNQRQNPVMGCESWKLCVMLLILMNLLASVRAQDLTPRVCIENGSYASNSTYGANLNTLLSSLSSNMGDNGFYNASMGENQDRVNALILCRCDQALDQCRSCVQTASVGLPQLCPNEKQAVIWYDSCMLRYSNEPIYGTQTNDPEYTFRRPTDAPNLDEFRRARTRLMDDLRVRAADGGSALKAGAGSINTSDSETLYGLMQCTPDLSPKECHDCLLRATQTMRNCCDIAAGVRVLMPSCNLRYELFLFYDDARLRELEVLVSRPPPLPSPPGTNGDNTSSGKKDDNTTKVVIIIVVPIAVCIILAACAAIFLRKRMKPRWQEIPETTDEVNMLKSLQYDFGNIRAATNDFGDANRLGQGEFGAVYRGKLLNGQEIAVKRLAKDSRQGNIEFKNEVLLVAKLQHRNLVKLLGFALEGTERVLIYEFVQNASLDQFIYDPVKRSYLDWDKRYKIIGGIVRGLLYLHEDSRLRIIHRDLKASNVLLDENMNSKITDFGMARLFGRDETQGNTNKIVGTHRYMSPEYAMHGQFSIKSDVFSFGVLILEILSGQRNNYIQNGENVEDLLTITWKNWQKETTTDMIDPVLLRNDVDSLREILRCIHIGLLCVQENAASRPTMTSIVLMLSSSTMTLPIPSEPAFYMAGRFRPNVSLFGEHDSEESNSSKVSNAKAGISDISITELYPP